MYSLHSPFARQCVSKGSISDTIDTVVAEKPRLSHRISDGNRIPDSEGFHDGGQNHILDYHIVMTELGENRSTHNDGRSHCRLIRQCRFKMPSSIFLCRFILEMSSLPALQLHILRLLPVPRSTSASVSSMAVYLTYSENQHCSETEKASGMTELSPAEELT
jgi:hypothetical protein